MRVLLLSRYDRLGASSRLRLIQYMDYFRKTRVNDLEFEISPLLPDAYVRFLYGQERSSQMVRVAISYIKRVRRLCTLRNVDLIWLEKELFPWTPYFIEKLFLRWRPYILDIDDAVFHRYDMHSSPWIRWLLGKKIDAIMKNSALVFAGSQYLVTRAELAGVKQIEMIPTVVDLNRYPFPCNEVPEFNVVLKIGWIGSPISQHYLQQLEVPLKELNAQFPIKLLVVGVSDDFEFSGAPMERIVWSESREVEIISSMDVGIMPLSDDGWAKGKCAYKLIQYMACGKPVVASRVGENCTVVKNGENGFLVSNSEEWLFALRQCKSRTLRKKLGQHGRELIEKKYSLQALSPRVVEIFKGITN